MIRRLTTNLALWLLTIGLASFWFVYAIFGQAVTIEIASGMLLGGCVVLALTWLPSAAIAIANGGRSGPDVLALGLCAMSTFGAIRQTWTLAYRYFGRPEWMLDHWSYPFVIWSVFWGLLIIILAPGTTEGDIPTSNKIYLIVAAIIGALVAGIAIGMSLAQSTF